MRTIDLHLNVFHAYRGASQDDVARERQLEDNLTRALAITITRLEGVEARATVLGALGVDSDHRAGLRTLRAEVTVPGATWPPSNRRRLLVVHGGPRLQLEGDSAELDEFRRV